MTAEERERIYRLAETMECLCGRRLTVAVKGGEPYLRCCESVEHTDYRPIRTLTQLYDAGEYINPYAAAAIEKNRRERLEEQGVPPEVQAMTIYGSDRHIMTASIAERAIRSLYPGRTRASVERAIMIAVEFNLNPLLKEIHIIHYPSKTGGPGTDEVVLGIEGNRKIAQRKTKYRYVEFFKAVPPDQMRDMGEDPTEKIGCTVVLGTDDNHLYPGVGFINRTATIMGEDKGNSRWNMVCIHAERNALKRLVPDDRLPARVMLFDTMFADIGTMEMPSLEAYPETAIQIEAPTNPDDWGACPIHHKPFREGKYGPHCTSKMPDGSYCKEKPKKRQAPKVDAGTGEIIDGEFTDLGPPLPDFDDPKVPESGTNVAKPNGPTQGPGDVIAGLLRGLKDAGYLDETGKVLTAKREDYLKLLADFGATKLSEITGEKIDTFKHRLADLALAAGSK